MCAKITAPDISFVGLAEKLVFESNIGDTAPDSNGSPPATGDVPVSDVHDGKLVIVKDKDIADFSLPCELKEGDVLLGRGHLVNHRVANNLYRIDMRMLKPLYKAAKTNTEKEFFARELVDCVHRRNGRFLKKWNGRWYKVTRKTALAKAKQCLRQDHSKAYMKSKRQEHQKTIAVKRQQHIDENLKKSSKNRHSVI